MKYRQAGLSKIQLLHRREQIEDQRESLSHPSRASRQNCIHFARACYHTYYFLLTTTWPSSANSQAPSTAAYALACLIH